jgi:uncharacterized membrane protein YccC
MDRSRYDSAMFWLPFGTAAAVIGLALMTIGVSRSAANANLLRSVWFDGGLGLLAIGAALLLWALWLFLVHRRTAHPPMTADPARRSEDPMVEAVRGYYREREKAMNMWDKLNDDRGKKPKS